MPSAGFQRDLKDGASLLSTSSRILASPSRPQMSSTRAKCGTDVVSTCCTNPPAPAKAALQVLSEMNIRAAKACESLRCQVACSHKPFEHTHTTHFGSAHADAKDDTEDQTTQRQIAATMHHRWKPSMETTASLGVFLAGLCAGTQR